MSITWIQLISAISILPRRQLSHFLRKHKFEVTVIAFMVAAIGAFAFPGLAFADQLLETQTANQKAIGLRVDSMINKTRSHGELPVAETTVPRRVVTMPVSAYTSRPQETDDTPFIGAAGTFVRHGMVATNYLPLGTQVRIPELYGDEIFVVEDRMNARYNKRMDIWMEDLDDAKEHGVQYLEIEIF